MTRTWKVVAGVILAGTSALALAAQASATQSTCPKHLKHRTAEETIREHIALLQAIVAGDEKAAAELTLSHVVGFERAIRALL